MKLMVYFHNFANAPKSSTLFTSMLSLWHHQGDRLLMLSFDSRQPDKSFAALRKLNLCLSIKMWNNRVSLFKISAWKDLTFQVRATCQKTGQFTDQQASVSVCLTQGHLRWIRDADVHTCYGLKNQNSHLWRTVTLAGRGTSACWRHFIKYVYFSRVVVTFSAGDINKWSSIGSKLVKWEARYMLL